MRMPPALHPEPPRVLIVTPRPDRGEPLGALVPPGCQVVTCAPGDSTPSPVGFGAVIVDGTPSCLPPNWAADLRRAVESGACLLVFSPLSLAGSTTDGGPAAAGWAELVGVPVASTHPAGEWFGKSPFPAGQLARRVPEEFSFVDALVCFGDTGDAVPLLYVSVAFSDRPVVVERRLGAGRLLLSGIGHSTAALQHRELAIIFRRALLSPAALSASEREIGLGILGYGPYGGMGLYHGLATQATAGLELVAACDADASRRKAAENEFPGLRSYGGVADLVADEDVELVIIATPPSTHFGLALELLRAGKHVALEKPMCSTLPEADRLIAAATESGVVLTIHQSRRWDPDFLAVKGCVEQGLLGEVFNVETFVGGFEHPCRAWHSEVSISGGAVYDWGSHHLDWILQLMDGFPTTLAAHGHKRVWNDVTNLDQVRVRLAWEDGREAEFLQSDVSAFRRPKFFVQGTGGTLIGEYRPLSFERVEPALGYVSEHAHHAEAPADLRIARYEPGTGLAETGLPIAKVARFEFHRNLADHLHLGEPLAVEPSSVRRVVALLEAAQRSTDLGNVPVALSLGGTGEISETSEA
jgi:predicted dehydrogenase